MKFLSTQCDSVIRNISRLYPYDIISDENEDDNEKTLRGSSQEIADSMEVELQKKVEDAGIEIMEVRIITFPIPSDKPRHNHISHLDKVM